jgi:hypothetical protein
MRSRATPEPISRPFGTHGPGHDHESHVMTPFWLADRELEAAAQVRGEPQREREDDHGGENQMRPCAWMPGSRDVLPCQAASRILDKEFRCALGRHQ